MKEESISTAKLFELNCLVTAVAVAMRTIFHIALGAGWLPILVDGLIAVVLFVFYGGTRYWGKPISRVIQWYLLCKQIAITLVWILWGNLQSIWPPVVVLIILIYMLIVGEARYRKLGLWISGVILLLLTALQLQENLFAFNDRQSWADYTLMTFYISSTVALLLGVVNNRVEDERRRSQQQSTVLEKARKAAEQRRDLLMRLKDLQSDFFLEQDLKPSFDNLLQQLLEVTHSSYGFMGELETQEAVDWQTKPHAQILSPLFKELPEAEQNGRISNFFRQIHKGSAPIFNNKIKSTVPVERQFGLSNYMGIPVTYNYKIVGAIVLANRKGGYSQEIMEELSPFISTYGSIIQNIRLKRAQKKYENELREAKELAEQSNRLKSQFLTNISHELRTPLSLILGPIDLLKQVDYQQLGEEQWRQQLELIEKNSKKMLSYIEDIVDLSKLNSDTLAAEPTTIDLQQFLEKIYQQTQEGYAHRKIDFVLNCQLPKAIGLYIDGAKLEKMIDNFLSNAFKYTKDGTAAKITLKAQLLAKELQISCCDSGAGISQEHFERIFNRFYQVEQPNESIFSGTGVGLALCKELSELLGITINVASEVGVGSCFTIHIPIDRIRKITNRVTVKKEVLFPPIEKKSTLLVGRSSKAPLLIVEDNRDMRSFLKQVLQAKYEVVVAKNGREAWEILQEQPSHFELIITDLMMPEMDGFTLINKVQAAPNISHLPIIVLTAKAQFDERLHCLRIGMDDYLTKPFEVEELQVMVRHLLSIKAKRGKM